MAVVPAQIKDRDHAQIAFWHNASSYLQKATQTQQ